MELLDKLCRTDGVSGHEDAVVELLRSELSPHLDETRKDSMGNFVGLKRGKGDELPRVMLAGHIDEIGFLIYNVDEDGFASIAPVGGWQAENIMGHRVKVHTRRGEVLQGLVNRRPALTPEKSKKALRLDEIYVDFGMSGEEAKERVSRGDWVSMESPMVEMGECLLSKAFDDRVGVYIIAEAAKRYENENIDLYVVGTSQEEVGLRGATVAAQAIKPDIGVAADITGSADTPGYPGRMRICKLGEGVAIKQMDRSVISSVQLVDFMRNLADKKKIDYQMEILVRGGTDTSAMQRFGSGTYSTCLSIPTRYGHSPNAVIHRHDVETAVELMTEFLNVAHAFLEDMES